MFVFDIFNLLFIKNESALSQGQCRYSLLPLKKKSLFFQVVTLLFFRHREGFFFIIFFFNWTEDCFPEPLGVLPPSRVNEQRGTFINLEVLTEDK